MHFSLSSCSQDTAAAYTNRAVCYQQHDKYDEIIADCTAALEINSQYAKAYLRRALAFEALEKYKKALADYNSAKENDPQNRQASDGVARCTKLLAQC